MLVVGSIVKVLPPFNLTFDGTYIIADLIYSEDGKVVYFLQDNESGFDSSYLEATE